MSKKKISKTKVYPRIFNWPISKERYKQILYKMYIQACTIGRLQVQNDRLKTRLSSYEFIREDFV